ncbi:MAG: hypothetical protein MRJ92_03230 [Nitrospira sp.]|nr:hypothetical protein [Nitrospira sp.]
MDGSTDSRVGRQLSGFLTLLWLPSRTTAQQQEERSAGTALTDLAVRAAAPLFMLGVLIALALGTSGNWTCSRTNTAGT